MTAVAAFDADLARATAAMLSAKAKAREFVPLAQQTVDLALSLPTRIRTVWDGLRHAAQRGEVEAARAVQGAFLGEVLERKARDDKGLLLKSEHLHTHDDGKEDDHGELHNPHVWLGPKQARIMVDAIAQRLGELEPSKKDNFRRRADAYKAQIDELLAYGRAKFKGKDLKIVTQHDSHGYFVKEFFDTKVVGYLQGQEGEDRGAAQFDKLIKLCREEKVQIIGHEPLMSKAKVEVLRQALRSKGLETELVELDSLESAPPEFTPSFYIDGMRKNIDHLAAALK